MAQDDVSGLDIAQAIQVLKRAADNRPWMVYANQGPVGPAVANTPQTPLPQINYLGVIARKLFPEAFMSRQDVQQFLNSVPAQTQPVLPDASPRSPAEVQRFASMFAQPEPAPDTRMPYTPQGPMLPQLQALAVRPTTADLTAPEQVPGLLPYTQRRAPSMSPEDQQDALEAIARWGMRDVPRVLLAFGAGEALGVPMPATDVAAMSAPEGLQDLAGIAQFGHAAAGRGPGTPWWQAQRPQPERPLWSPGQRLDITFPPEGPRPEQEFIQRMMEDRVAKTIGVIPGNAPPEVKLQRLVELATPELLEQLEKPAAESGIEWYSGDQKLARQLNQRVFPELADDTTHAFHTAVSAPMSSGQNPKSEVTMANRIWDIFRNNGFRELPETQPDGSLWGRNSGQIVKLNSMLRDMGNIDNVADWLRSWQRVDDIRRYRPGAEGKANDVVPGGLVFGPKIGRYFWDLLGIPHEGSTVDLWDTRGNQRRLGRLFDAQGNPIEAPTEVDRDIFMELHRILGDQTGLERKQAQSGLWHYEQDLYRRLGLQAPSYKRSDGARAYLRSIGIEP